MKRFLVVLIMLLMSVASPSFAQETINFGWEQNSADLPILEGWRLWVSTVPGGPYDAGLTYLRDINGNPIPAVNILYDGIPKAEYTGAAILVVSEVTTLYFVATAWNSYGDSTYSNEVPVLFNYIGPEIPINFVITDAVVHPNGPLPNQPPNASFTANPTSGTVPLLVSFNGSGSSDPDGSIVSYVWAFGDGGGTGMAPSHTYTSVGTYTVTLTVTDDDGATDTATTTIQVTSAPIPNQAPTASFTATPPSGDAPLMVSFDGSGSSDPDGSIVSYVWAFGDGGGTGMSPSHTYNNVGTYTVTLTVTDDDGATDTATTTIQVNNPSPGPG